MTDTFDTQFSYLALVKIIILPLATLMIATLDPDLVFWLATIIGAVIGAIISAEQMPKGSYLQFASVIASAMAVGVVFGVGFTWYFNVEAWQAVLLINFGSGFLGLQSAAMLYKIHRNQFQRRIEKKLAAKFGEIDEDNDKITHSQRRKQR